MSRYIDADAWLKDMECTNKFLDTLKHKIADAPSIDIVRCNECKFWNTDRAIQDKAYCEMHSGYTKDDNYCAWAERISDE